MPGEHAADFVDHIGKKARLGGVGHAAAGRVADAINEAPPGRVIAGSEERVRDLFAGLREQAFEKGLQMRVDAAEAAFSPSEGQ